MLLFLSFRFPLFCLCLKVIYFKFSKPNVVSVSAMGKVFSPRFVNVYSTLGGISGYAFLNTNLCSTKKFSSWINIFSLIPGIAFLSSPYLITLSLI